MAMPEQFTEIAYVAISDSDGNQIQYGTITSSIELNLGARDIEQIVTVAGGRIVKFVPQEMGEIGLEIEPVGIRSYDTTVDDIEPSGMIAWYIGLSPNASSGIVSRTRKTFRVTILWTDQTLDGVSDAAGAIGLGDSFRLSFWGCYMTEQPVDFTDGTIKTKVTFKCPPFNKAAKGMIKAEEEDAGTLATLGAYSGAAPS